MFKAPLDLGKARILVTNDDGIHAPGLKILERVARRLSSDVWVVAPEAEQSGASHSLTLRRPLQVHRIGPRRFAVAGTPTDCVLVAVNRLIEGRRPDMVLSGINRGANLGEDYLYSGTVSAAMEGAMLDIPSIAFSQVRAGEILHWLTAERFAAEVIQRLVSFAWPKGVLMSVNFPPVPPTKVTGIEVGAQGRRVSKVQVIHARDPFERETIWIGDFPSDEPVAHDTDLGSILRNAIAVTPLHFDLTHAWALKLMETAFAKKKSKARPRSKKPKSAQ